MKALAIDIVRMSPAIFVIVYLLVSDAQAKSTSFGVAVVLSKGRTLTEVIKIVIRLALR